MHYADIYDKEEEKKERESRNIELIQLLKSLDKLSCEELKVINIIIRLLNPARLFIKNFKEIIKLLAN